MTPTDTIPEAAEPRFADQTKSPTSISEWKRPARRRPAETAEGFLVDLPSGNCIMMTRTLDMPLLLRQGQIPNPLAGIVQKMIDKKSTIFPKEAQEDPTALMQLLDLMNETCVRAILQPPFSMPDPRGKGETAEQYQDRLTTWEPDADTLSVWDLEMDDRVYIFAVAQGAAADLASFRAESQRTLDDLQAGEGVRKPTKRTGGAGPKKKR